jgi:hypothetical protein
MTAGYKEFKDTVNCSYIQTHKNLLNNLFSNKGKLSEICDVV